MTHTPSLDVFTVKVMTLVNMIVLSGAALTAWRLNRPVKGMRQFAWGMFVFWNGSLISLVRVIGAAHLMVALGNALMFLGALSIVQGIRAFRGWKPLNNRAVAAAGALTAALFFYWMFVYDSFVMRIAVVSPGFSLLALDAAVSMFRGVRARERAIYWPAGAAFAVIAVDLAARGFGAIAGQYGRDFLASVPIEIISGISSNVAYTACAFGMLMASSAALRGQYEKMALFDALTNLPNRRHLLERLAEIEKRVSGNRRIGIIYLDLDGFKQVNDTLGHQAGDHVLVSISSAMAEVVGGNCLARIGGDEFVVLVENPRSRSVCLELGNRLKRAAESCALPGLPLRISCGIAISPEDGQSSQEILRAADLAMYREKRSAVPAPEVISEGVDSYLPV